MKSSFLTVEDNNISTAWVRTMKAIVDHPGMEICPLMLTLTGFDEKESVRDAIDEQLNRDGINSVATIAETIFPQSIYEYCDEDAERLYDRYQRALPRIMEVDSRNNRGTYFQRLIAFEGVDGPINQLKTIIHAKGERRSKMQAAIFDPRRDHLNGPYQGFPCLQHVTFYQSENGGLVLNCFYALQLIYQKAYGNWVGLCNLGKFVAAEMDIPFERFNCYVGVEKLEEMTKTQAKQLIEKSGN